MQLLVTVDLLAELITCLRCVLHHELRQRTANWPPSYINVPFVPSALRTTFFLGKITKRYWRDCDFCKEPCPFCSPLFPFPSTLPASHLLALIRLMRAAAWTYRPAAVQPNETVLYPCNLDNVGAVLHAYVKLGICLSQTILPKTRSVAVKGIIARVTTYFYARDKRQLITAFQRRAYSTTIFHVPLLCTSISTTSIRCNHAIRSKPLYLHRIFSITMEERFSVVNSLLLAISSKGEFDISRQTFHFSN